LPIANIIPDEFYINSFTFDSIIKKPATMDKVKICFIFLLIAGFVSFGFAPGREYYELRIYTLKDKSQEEKVEQFLKDAYIPALHRAGVKKVGVFKPLESDTTYGKRIFVLIPYASIEQMNKMPGVLAKDKAMASGGSSYLDAPYDNPPYARMQTILMQAFTGHPQLAAPKLTSPVTERVYELRSYEAHTEKIYDNKVKMFNDGDEVGLFNRLGFNAVFYGEVIAGPRMPNLMYMTTFENQESRDAHWKSFREDPQWKTLSAMPEYQHNVSKADIFFLRPTSYSDI
jgi:hypothetical protein